MDLKNKTQLEKYFADHFDTVLFPILADIYKTEGDLTRARKVCEIGLEYHPNNVEGLFILAEVNKLEDNLESAERLLKNLLAVEPLHYRAAVSLVNIQSKLNRAPESVAILWRKIVKINPTHPEAKSFFQKTIKPKKEQASNDKTSESKEFFAEDANTIGVKQNFETISKKQETVQDDFNDEEKIFRPKPPSIKPQKISEEELQSLEISPRMSTFTMVNVLKKQKLYQQALSVLKMLEEKGADSALIKQERENLQTLITESELK